MSEKLCKGEGVFDESWPDKTVWMKRFWATVFEGVTPEWFSIRCDEIEKKYDVDTLNQWDLNAIEMFLNSGLEEGEKPVKIVAPKTKKIYEVCHYPECDENSEILLPFPGTDCVIPLCSKHAEEATNGSAIDKTDPEILRAEMEKRFGAEETRRSLYRTMGRETFIKLYSEHDFNSEKNEQG